MHLIFAHLKVKHNHKPAWQAKSTDTGLDNKIELNVGGNDAHPNKNKYTKKFATSGAGTAYPPRAPEFTPGFYSRVHVTRSLVLCVWFVDSCLSFCIFSFDHCVVCSSIYGF